MRWNRPYKENVDHHFRMKQENPIISEGIRNALSKLSEAFERFKNEYPDELNMIFKDHDELFAKFGWYIYEGTSVEEVLMILKLFNQGNSAEAENMVEVIFENNIKEIERDLSSLNFNSRHIINEAFICHNKELYYASTILFLSLTDGLANGKLFTKQYIDKIKRKSKNHFLLDIFTENNPVNKRFIPNKSSNYELMRHGIMHGNSKNYGSRINSLKAISLFHYVSCRRYELFK